jgi:prephenate dehydrogenase
MPKKASADGPPVFGRIAIVGCGLIGGAIALAARQRWPRIHVIAIDRPDVVRAAKAASIANVVGDDLALAVDADLVVLAAPVLENIRLLERLARSLRPGTLVTDVSGTKRLIVAAAADLPVAFIGGHPMAGAAMSGFTHARADLFHGHPWILTPLADHSARLPDLEAFVSALGGVPHVMTPDLHDRFVGAVSHLPQVSASALMHVVGKLAGDAGLELAGAGLRDATRLAGSPPAIWKDIAATNEDVIGPALDELIRVLQTLRGSLHDGAAIDATFTSACRWRDALLRARGEP